MFTCTCITIISIVCYACQERGGYLFGFDEGSWSLIQFDCQKWKSVIELGYNQLISDPTCNEKKHKIILPRVFPKNHIWLLSTSYLKLLLRHCDRTIAMMSLIFNIWDIIDSQRSSILFISTHIRQPHQEHASASDRRNNCNSAVGELICYADRMWTYTGIIQTKFTAPTQAFED